MQYELWGKKRPVNGVGSQFEKIEVFNDECNKYYVMSKLDTEIYKEGLVIQTEWQQEPRVVLYQEFDLPYTKRLKR